MSLSDLLVNTSKPWANLYVNSLNVANPIPPQTFSITAIAQAATPTLPQTLNINPVVIPNCKLEKFGDVYLFSIPRWELDELNQRTGVLVLNIAGSPLASSTYAGNAFSYLSRASGSFASIGWGYDSPSNRLFGLNPTSSAGFTGTGVDFTFSQVNIWLRAI